MAETGGGAGEVRRVCREMGLADWTALGESVPPEDAVIVRAAVGGEALLVTPEDFRRGLEVELEHGLRFPDADVTGNHPLLTGRIVLAHLKETLDYYDRLEVAELEGDVQKALESGDAAKLAAKSRALAAARARMRSAEASRLRG